MYSVNPLTACKDNMTRFCCKNHELESLRVSDVVFNVVRVTFAAILTANCKPAWATLVSDKGRLASAALTENLV